MISSQYTFVYLHVPKTGGNSIQTVLLPFSDDTLAQRPDQDGIDRFGVQGAVTPRKHARLAEYVAVVPEIRDTHRIVISVRHPFERAVSGYFSPHRWIRQQGDTVVKVPPVWDEAAFFDLLATASHAPACDFLQLDDGICQPDLVLRFETLQQDFRAAVAALGLPVECSKALPHVNRTAGSSMMSDILNSRALRDEVEARHKVDMDFFDYHTYTQTGGG